MRDTPLHDEAPSPLHSAVRLQSAWHSPVPYLFGGLAAMLGLIAFALLILACSYWKLSGYVEGGGGGDDGGHDSDSSNDGAAAASDTKRGGGDGKAKMGDVLVIMAGQLHPTYLATPSNSRSTSFGDETGGETADGERSGEGKDEKEAVVVVVEMSAAPAADAGRGSSTSTGGGDRQ